MEVKIEKGNRTFGTGGIMHRNNRQTARKRRRSIRLWRRFAIEARRCSGRLVQSGVAVTTMAGYYLVIVPMADFYMTKSMRTKKRQEDYLYIEMEVAFDFTGWFKPTFLTDS